ncbi:MAG: glycosyltransferase, partial [Proteobacteria bacterium]|nr:glycosyltransferase [Pseudomonadota bacterium]
LVVDDASTDETPAVLAQIAKSDPRVRCLRLPQPSGAPAARNEALRQAKGRFVTGIDDDDEMLPGRIAALVAAFEHRYEFVCSGAYIDRGAWRRPSRNSRLEITLDMELYRDEVGTQILTLKERMYAAGLFDEQMPASQDYDMWTRLLAHGGTALRIAEPTYVAHIDPERRRISDRGADGAKRYLAKHGAMMNSRQRTLHRLKIFMLDRRRMTLSDATSFLTRDTWKDVARYLVTSNVPALRRLGDCYRRWRWSTR